MLVRVDPDVFFHLKDGERVLAERRVPTNEEDSFTRAGSDLVAMEWLSSTAFAGAYRLGGYRFIAVLSALLLFATLALLGRVLEKGSPEAPKALLVALAAFGFLNFGMAKVQNFTFLFFALDLYLIRLWEKGDRRAPWLMALVLVPWVNLHGGFVFGWVILAGACGLDFLRSRRALSLAPWAAGTAACFIHPDGARAFAYPIWFFFAAPPTRNFVLEWMPIGLELKNIPYAVIAIAALVARVDRLRSRWPWAAMTVVLLVLALRTAKLLPFFTLTACAATGVAGGFSRQGKRALAAAAAVLLAILVIVVSEARRMKPYGPISDWTREYPRVALEHWQRRDEGRRLFHHYDWGAYLLWAMPTGSKVFIDGRLEPYWTLIPDYETMMGAQPGWRGLLEKYKIETALLPFQVPLARELKADAGWRAIGDDGRAILFEKISRSRAAAIR